MANFMSPWCTLCMHNFNIKSFATIKKNSAPTCTYQIAPQMHSHHNYSADRLSFFLQHLISMPIYKLNLYLNTKNWLKSVFIKAYLYLAHRLLDDRYPQILHIYTHNNAYMLIPYLIILLKNKKNIKS